MSFPIDFALNLWLLDLAVTAFLSNTEKILSLGMLLLLTAVTRAGSFLSAKLYYLPHFNIMLIDAFRHMDSSRSVSVSIVGGLTTI